MLKALLKGELSLKATEGFGRSCRHPPAAAGSGDDLGKHQLDFPKLSRKKDPGCSNLTALRVIDGICSMADNRR